MITQHIGLTQINGSLVVLDGVRDAAYEEVVTLTLKDGSTRTGRVIALHGETAVIQVFEGTAGISLTDTKTLFTGHPMELTLAPKLYSNRYLHH